MGPVAVVAFDAYGTLFDTGTGSIGAVRAILRKVGADLDPGEFYAEWKVEHARLCRSEVVFATEAAIFKRGLATMYERFGIRGDAATDVVIMLATLGRRTPFPDAMATIELVRRRCMVVIASNSDTAPLASDVARCGLEVDGIFTSEMARAYKPDEEFYAALAQHVRCSPEQVTFVGDSIDEDVLAPIRCGMLAVWLNRPGAPAVADVPVTISCLASLPAHLSGRAR